MKRVITFIVTLCLCLQPNFTVFAQTAQTAVSQDDGEESIGDWEFKVNDGSETVTITKYVGKGSKVSVPSSINGKKVVSIGDSALSWCNTITSVQVPDSVVHIGKSAFSQCVKLENVTLPSGIQKIEDYTFYSSGKLASINIPSSVASIGDYAFSECFGLTHVNIHGRRTFL